MDQKTILILYPCHLFLSHKRPYYNLSLLRPFLLRPYHVIASFFFVGHFFRSISQALPSSLIPLRPYLQALPSSAIPLRLYYKFLLTVVLQTLPSLALTPISQALPSPVIPLPPYEKLSLPQSFL